MNVDAAHPFTGVVITSGPWCARPRRSYMFAAHRSATVRTHACSLSDGALWVTMSAEPGVLLRPPEQALSP